MRVLICGDRNWGNNYFADGRPDNERNVVDRAAICREVAKLPKTTIVIHGAARGADTMAGDAAMSIGLRVITFPAEWKRYGRRAGIVRNQAMLDNGQPDRVIAFHRDIDRSRGTRDMVLRAFKAGVPYSVFTK